MDSVIVHFTKAGKPVLPEILDASRFLVTTMQATKRAHQFENLANFAGTRA